MGWNVSSSSVFYLFLFSRDFHVPVKTVMEDIEKQGGQVKSAEVLSKISKLFGGENWDQSG